MPRIVRSRLAAACALAVALLFSTAAVAAAKGVSVDLRVVGAGGRALAEETLKTGTTRVPTSPKATCLGKGSGGSGRPVTVEGPTALGLLAQAAKSTASLRPLLVTDAFESEFGLGLCAIGGAKATAKRSWYLKVNHRNPNLGGDSVKLRKGDEVLWALVPFPYPKELALEAPGEAIPGVPFTVRVFSYDDRGRRRPAAGATVPGATGPTGSDGRATVVVTGPTELVASHGADIPSNGAAVCVLGACPQG
ncbi:MAG TPA: hypothetical protein VH476_10990 [Solirubrobacterales bacterium]